MTRTPTPVNLTLELASTNGTRASQVAHALIEAIAGGQLHDGDRLPSTRTLAATFGLARSAVVAAYEELTAAGFLAARAGGFLFPSVSSALRAVAVSCGLAGHRSRSKIPATPRPGSRWARRAR